MISEMSVTAKSVRVIATGHGLLSLVRSRYLLSRIAPAYMRLLKPEPHRFPFSFKSINITACLADLPDISDDPSCSQLFLTQGIIVAPRSSLVLGKLQVIIRGPANSGD